MSLVTRMMVILFLCFAVSSCGGGGGSSDSASDDTASGESDGDSGTEDGNDSGDDSEIVRTGTQNAPRFAGTWVGTLVSFQSESRCEWQITLQFESTQYEQQQTDYFSGTASATIVEQSHEGTLYDECLAFGEIPIAWSAIGLRGNPDRPWNYLLTLDDWDGDFSDKYREPLSSNTIFPDDIFTNNLSTTDENRFENTRSDSRDDILNFERQ